MPAFAFLTPGDDPALDFLNTVAKRDSGMAEYLETDEDVISWMQLMGFLDKRDRPSFRRGALVAAARELRDTIRKLVLQKKSGKRVDAAALNAFLSHGRYRVNLMRSPDGDLGVVHEYDKATPEQLLARIAETAADLLANGNFDVFRKCESEDCVLWFYDRTKAHRRR